MLRKPTSPGEILREEFLKPLGLTQKELADHLGCDVKVINRIVNDRSAVTAEMAVRLAATARKNFADTSPPAGELPPSWTGWARRINGGVRPRSFVPTGIRISAVRVQERIGDGVREQYHIQDEGEGKIEGEERQGHR